MRINDLTMRVARANNGRHAARTGGVAGGVDEATNRRGYPPMSNRPGPARADKKPSTPSPIFPSPVDRSSHPDNQFIFPSPHNRSSHPDNAKLSPSPVDRSIQPANIILIPEYGESEDLDFSQFLPRTFEPDISATILATAPQKFFPKIIDKSLASNLSKRLIAYFSRPLEGWYEETVFYADGTEKVIRKPYSAKAPLLAEFANMNGMTERELKTAAQDFPDTLGRAVEFAKDVLKTYLVRKGLTGETNPQVTIFTATNETDMKVKSERTERHVDVNDILDRIERAEKPLIHESNNNNNFSSS